MSEEMVSVGIVGRVPASALQKWANRQEAERREREARRWADDQEALRQQLAHSARREAERQEAQSRLGLASWSDSAALLSAQQHAANLAGKVTSAMQAESDARDAVAAAAEAAREAELAMLASDDDSALVKAHSKAVRALENANKGFARAEAKRIAAGREATAAIGAVAAAERKAKDSAVTTLQAKYTAARDAMAAALKDALAAAEQAQALASFAAHDFPAPDNGLTAPPTDYPATAGIQTNTSTRTIFELRKLLQMPELAGPTPEPPRPASFGSVGRYLPSFTMKPK